MITRAVNESIRIVLRQDIRYQDLISTGKTLKYSYDAGQYILMNKIASDVALTIQHHFGQIKVFTERNSR